MANERLILVGVGKDAKRKAALLSQALNACERIYTFWAKENSEVHEETRLKRLFDASVRRVNRRRKSVAQDGFMARKAMLVFRPDEDVALVPSDTLERLVNMAWAGVSSLEESDFLEMIKRDIK